MTLLVRDAERILRENLEFHIKQGVDFFIVTDNCSVDGTRDIIDEYVSRGFAERIWEPQDDYSQGRWVTRMARLAATSYRADWIINSDDDEFWAGYSGSLRDELAQISGAQHALAVERFNHPPVAGSATKPFLSAMIYREVRSTNIFGGPLLPKVCHRAFSDIKVEQGNHAVARPTEHINTGATGAITISHFPVRDFASFERKIAKGGAAYARNTTLPPDEGTTWRWLFDLWRLGGLREWYERQLLQPDDIVQRLADGTLVIDRSVRGALHPAGD